MVTLPTVEIPGYADALRREHEIRTSAFLGANEVVCGVEVRPLSLRTLVRLEVAMNGFVVPCRFDDDSEAIAHALQVIWFCRPKFDATFGVGSRFGMFRSGIEIQTFILRTTLVHWRDRLKIAHEVKAWIRDAFMDAPKGDGSQFSRRQSFATYPAHIIDTLHGYGIKATMDEIMDMPLKRLWQHWRVAVKRENPKYPLVNPSDEIAVAAINKR